MNKLILLVLLYFCASSTTFGQSTHATPSLLPETLTLYIGDLIEPEEEYSLSCPDATEAVKTLIKAAREELSRSQFTNRFLQSGCREERLPEGKYRLIAAWNSEVWIDQEPLTIVTVAHSENSAYMYVSYVIAKVRQRTSRGKV